MYLIFLATLDLVFFDDQCLVSVTQNVCTSTCGSLYKVSAAVVQFQSKLETC
jgi:hypothetical protein